MFKKLTGILIGVSIVLLTSSCTSKTKTDVSLSPFAQYESWDSDESGLYIEGKQVSNTLERYGILKDLIEEINDVELTDFNACTAVINGYALKDKKIALLRIEQGHLQIYIMFSSSGDIWKADGYTYQRERFETAYRIERSSDGLAYWLVLQNEKNHGTGLSLMDEVWINPDGSIAARYPLSGWSYFLPDSLNNAWAEYSSTPYYDGDHTITLDYSIAFHLKYNDNFQSVYAPVVREYWTYNLQKSEFTFMNSEPELPDELNRASYDRPDDYGILARYFEYYKSHLPDKTVLSLEDWEALMMK